MATSEKTVTVYSCDSGCGTERIGRDGELPPGIHLTVHSRRDTRVDTGTAEAPVFSCNVAHVRKAVENVTLRHNVGGLEPVGESDSERDSLHLEDEETGPETVREDEAQQEDKPAYV